MTNNLQNYLKSPLNYKKNKLYFDHFNLEALVKDKKIKTPCYLYFKHNLVEHFNAFKQSTQKHKITNPMICFAAKSNSHAKVLKTLKQLGAGADIVSVGELKLVLAAKIPPEKIVFSGVGKTQEEIKETLKLCKDNLFSFNVESKDELDVINFYGKKLKLKPRVALRLNPSVKAKTHKHISTGDKFHKFGLLEHEIIQLSSNKKYWTNAQLVGLSVHIGSQLTCLEATQEALNQIESCKNQLKQNLSFIDVGGGLGIDYYHNKNASKLSSINEYMKIISNFSRRINKSSNTDIQIIFEPGRWLSARSGILISNVTRLKEQGHKKFIILDAGMNDLIRPSLYEAHHQIYNINRLSSSKETYDVVGPVCESTDIFAVDRKLSKVKKDDLLIIADAGAYGRSMSSNYNARDLTREYFIH